MSYPKWLQRSGTWTCGAFEEHEGDFYIGNSDDLYRLDSWCENSEGVLEPTMTDILDLPGYYGPIRNLKSALGYIWISQGTTTLAGVGRYDTTTDTYTILGMPSPLCDGGECYSPDDIELYNDDVYILFRHEWSGWLRLARWNEGTGTFDYLGGPGSPGVPWSFTDSQPAFDLQAHDGLLYFGHSHELKSWDGSSYTTVFDFLAYSGDGYVLGLESVESDLYILTGRWNKPTKLWVYDGSSVSLVCQLVGSGYWPIDMAYRLMINDDGSKDATMYIVAYDLNSIYRVDLTTSTSSLDVSSGGENDCIYYRSSDDTLWAGYNQTKVWTENLCRVAHTYFFLA